MGNVGAEGHFEYAPVGDIVNATQRVETLNKKLGTKLLASEELLEGTTDIMSRKLGSFLLAGKSNPLVIHELLVPSEKASQNHQLYFETFPEGLDLFLQKKWELAGKKFQQCLDSYPDDGPSKFFLGLCESYRVNPPPHEWQGVIPVNK